MLIDGNAERRRRAVQEARLSGEGSDDFRASWNIAQRSAYRAHLTLFNQHPRIFQPAVQTTIGNWATNSYDQHQESVRNAAGQGAMRTSGLHYGTQAQSTYNQMSSVSQAQNNTPQNEQMRPDDPIALARAKIEAATSDPSYVDPMANLDSEPAVQTYASHGISQIEQLLMQAAENQSRSEVANA